MLLITLFLTSVLLGNIYGLEVGSGQGLRDEVNDDPCELPNGVFPDPDSCEVFIRCQIGKPEVHFCSNGLLFNPLRLTCDFSRTEHCSDLKDFGTSARVETNDIACSEEEPNIYPIQNSCTEYYICENNIAFKVKCPEGLLMNSKKMTCDYSENVECDAVSKTEDSTAGIAIFENDEMEVEAETAKFSYIDENFTQSAETTVQTNAETDFDRKVINEGDLSNNSKQNLRDVSHELLSSKDYFDLGDISGDSEIDLKADLFDEIQSKTSSKLITKMSFPENTNNFETSSELIKTEHITLSRIELNSSEIAEHFKYVSTDPDGLYTNTIESSSEIYKTSHVLDDKQFESFMPDIATDFSQNTTIKAKDFVTIQNTSKAILIDENEVITDVNTYSSPTENWTVSSKLSEKNTEPLDVALNPICLTLEGNFPYPGNCNRFYNCVKGIPTISSCIENEHFDPVKRICTNPCLARCVPNADCFSSKMATLTTLGAFRFCSQRDFLSQSNCSEYLDCTTEIPIKLECPTGLHFNPTTRVCDWPYKAECNTLPKPLFKPKDLLLCPCESCLIPSTTSCSEYYLCLGYTAYKMNCSYNLNFDRNKNTCNYAFLVDCNDITSSSTTEKEPIESSTKTSTTELSILTTRTPSTSKIFFVCPRREGHFRYPGNCGMYYQCSNWYPYLMHCAVETHFNKITNRCDYPCEAKCDLTLNCGSPLTTSLSNPRCSCINCRLPASESCTKYIMCVDGKARIEDCPSGQIFDVKSSNCEWAHKVACHLTLICPENNGIFPHKDDCRKFVHCANGLPSIKDCPNMLEYDPVKKRCEWPSNRCNYLAVTGEELDVLETEEKRKGWTCPESFGCFSDDKHCNIFYHCSFGIATVKECSPGLLYNSWYQTCDWEKKVQCNSNHNKKAKRCDKFEDHYVCLDDRKPQPHALCNMYFDCTSGRACARQCPIGLYFNSLTGLCDFPENVKCFNPGKDEYSLKDLSLKCASGFEGRVVNPTNEACFYHCQQGKVVSRCCSKEQIYNFHKNNCEYRTKSFRSIK